MNVKISSNTNLKFKTDNKKISSIYNMREDALYRKYFYRVSWNPNNQFVDLEKENKFLNNFCETKKTQILFNDYFPHFYCFHKEDEIINSLNKTKPSNLNLIAEKFFAINYDNSFILQLLQSMTDEDFAKIYFSKLSKDFGDSYELREELLGVDLFKSVRITKSGVIFEDYNPTKEHKEEFALFYQYFFYDTLIDYFKNPSAKSIVDITNFQLLDSFFTRENKINIQYKNLWNEFLLISPDQIKIPDYKSDFNKGWNQSKIIDQLLVPASYFQIINSSGFSKDFVNQVEKYNQIRTANEYLNFLQIPNRVFKKIMWNKNNRDKILPINSTINNETITKSLPYSKISFSYKGSKIVLSEDPNYENVLFGFYILILIGMLLYLSILANNSLFKKLHGTNTTDYLFSEINWFKIFKR
ncbi:hypothetical protein [Spiroplasma alleghenense]|nr:hypothetical protein [Spiroplasma alleghenense]